MSFFFFCGTLLVKNWYYHSFYMVIGQRQTKFTWICWILFPNWMIFSLNILNTEYKFSFLKIVNLVSIYNWNYFISRFIFHNNSIFLGNHAWLVNSWKFTQDMPDMKYFLCEKKYFCSVSSYLKLAKNQRRAFSRHDS